MHDFFLFTSSANFPFIRRLNLLTVIRLSPEVPMVSEMSFFRENGINFVRFVFWDRSHRLSTDYIH
jgi:hypothetical protein